MAWLDNIKRLGRTFEMEGVLWCGQSGSGAEFLLQGGECNITLVGDDRAPDEPRTARAAVSVNGERVADVMLNLLSPNEKRAVTVKGRSNGTPVIVRVVKLSEVQDSSFGIAGIETDGSIRPAPEKKRKLEFIGDSITCAFGVDGRLEDEYRTNDEDAEKSFACIAANMLDADCSLVAMSGFGVLSGYSDDGNMHPENCVPRYYDSLGFSAARFGGLVFPQDVAWDFGRFRPDTVIINLGTNDWSYCKDKPSSAMLFSEKYAEFIMHVREKNPDARIVCSLGILGDGLFEAIGSAAKAYCAKTGDDKVDVFRFEEHNIVVDGVGVCGHPSFASHLKAAKALAAYLSDMRHAASE